ncbi:hypothetical protein E2C01_057447 [Portunus trituberculatus]|uniref:Uncharacterized protein n=1 Tax=Portunus trituberculatus TaxID=210409 RepID=A0A5B7H0C9_PORTR|nr:hypothetical protein [Portunus trituberculatus]
MYFSKTRSTSQEKRLRNNGKQRTTPGNAASPPPPTTPTPHYTTHTPRLEAPTHLNTNPQATRSPPLWPYKDYSHLFFVIISGPQHCRPQAPLMDAP